MKGDRRNADTHYRSFDKPRNPLDYFPAVIKPCKPAAAAGITAANLKERRKQTMEFNMEMMESEVATTNVGTVLASAAVTVAVGFLICD